MRNYSIEHYDYYNRPTGPDPFGPGTCRPDSGLNVRPAAPWEQAIAEHNDDKYAHQYILSLIRNSNGNYYSVDSLTARNAISVGLRVEGTLVYVIETDSLYQLKNGIENENWVELNINSENYAKLGRYNAPENPEDGTIYFDFNTGRLKYYKDGWNTIPDQTDLQNAMTSHNEDANAHKAKFEEVENNWLEI